MKFRTETIGEDVKDDRQTHGEAQCADAQERPTVSGQ